MLLTNTCYPPGCSAPQDGCAGATQPPAPRQAGACEGRLRGVTPRRAGRAAGLCSSGMSQPTSQGHRGQAFASLSVRLVIFVPAAAVQAIQYLCVVDPTSA